jgi:hypothetical protein
MATHNPQVMGRLSEELPEPFGGLKAPFPNRTAEFCEDRDLRKSF